MYYVFCDGGVSKKYNKGKVASPKEVECNTMDPRSFAVSHQKSSTGADLSKGMCIVK